MSHHITSHHAPSGGFVGGFGAVPGLVVRVVDIGVAQTVLVAHPHLLTDQQENKHTSTQGNKKARKQARKKACKSVLFCLKSVDGSSLGVLIWSVDNNVCREGVCGMGGGGCRRGKGRGWGWIPPADAHEGVEAAVEVGGGERLGHRVVLVPAGVGRGKEMRQRCGVCLLLMVGWLLW